MNVYSGKELLAMGKTARRSLRRKRIMSARSQRRLMKAERRNR